jgi:Protein of unknown function (DUF732)
MRDWTAAVMVGFLLVSVPMAGPANADLGYGSASPEDDAFITAITGDGISLNRSDAIAGGHAVCTFLLSGSGSMWEAIMQVKQMHGWSIVPSTHFVDRSVQNYCPSVGPS